MNIVKKKQEKELVPKNQAIEKEAPVVEKVTGEVVSQGFSSAERERYRTLCEEIGKEISKVEHAALSIALKINMIYRNKLYQVGNYANIYDMVSAEFGLGRASCNNYINICENFCEYDEGKNVYTGLSSKYKKYSMSQLTAMLPMEKALREEITPDMSVREIKRKRQIYDEHSRSDKDGDKTGTSKTDISKIVKKEKRVELVRSSVPPALQGEEKETLQREMARFEEEYPDVEYEFVVSIVYG